MNKKNIRKNAIPVGGKELTIPCYFPSISSIKTNLLPLDYLKALVALKHPLILISAYDIYNSQKKHKLEIFKLLDKAKKNRQIILLDSGNYESFWNKDKTWKEKCFHEILKTELFNISLSFDMQNPPPSVKSITTVIKNRVLKEESLSNNVSIIPIIHAPRDLLIDTVREVVKCLQPLSLAIPERLLGNGLIERAKSICQIRKCLDSTGDYYPLHLLGTGNPLSILLYVACGADSFDGLEWCQTTVDHDTGLLYHFQQRDIFKTQTKFNNIKNISYALATLAHNLDFYTFWMAKIQKQCLSKRSLYPLLKKYYSEFFLSELKNNIPS